MQAKKRRGQVNDQKEELLPRIMRIIVLAKQGVGKLFFITNTPVYVTSS